MPSNSGTIYLNQQKKKSVSFRQQKGLLVKKKESETLDRLVKRASLIIFEAASVLPPISSFKNKITICCNRVTITYNGIFTRDEYPMPIENVTGARIFRDFMFASLYIDTFGIVKPEPLKYLKITDARLARRYILALIECKKANIDLPIENVVKLRQALKNIGMVRLSATDDRSKYHNI